MQISSRFTIAIHMLLAIDTFKDEYKVTSDFLASSTNVNPVIIRNILGQLRKYDLIETQRGSGGTVIKKPLNEITLLDVYNAVDSVNNDSLFHFHENPNLNCPVGKNIHNVLDQKLQDIQKAMEEEMKKTTIADIKNNLQNYLN